MGNLGTFECPGSLNSLFDSSMSSERVESSQNLLEQKMKFSIKDFFSKCDQIRRKLRIWSHLLKKSLMENSFFVHLFTRTKEIK